MIRRAVIVATGVLALLAVAGSVMEKERVLREGQRVRLQLRPVDPRSLMQGDYMLLRYGVSDALGERPSLPPDGTVALVLDGNDVATLAAPGEAGDTQLKYRVRARGRRPEPRVSTDAFYFEEGTADRYVTAKYAELRVDDAGDSVLVGLLGEDFALLGEGVVR